MASSTSSLLFICLLLFLTDSSALQTPPSSSLNLTAIKTVCKTTPYPESCFSSLKLSISITINPNILSFLLQTLQTAIAESQKVSELLSTAGQRNNLVEKQRGTVKDCQELHQVTVNALRRSLSRVRSKPTTRALADAKTYLSAALTNKDTCLDSIGSASGPIKGPLVESIEAAYEHVSNSLSMLTQHGGDTDELKPTRHLLEVPTWRSEYDPSEVLTVAADGTGNFTSIGDAVEFAPNNSDVRVIIYVREGVYEENVEIPSYKINIVLVGDGSDVTVVTGNRSVGGGWTTFRSATLAVSGEGFLARDITIENTAGPENHQAVALRVNADFAALYRCTFNSNQDTLYVHSFRQFFRECDIFGTVDYIFGNAAVVFQNCNIVSKMPLPGQFTVATAQSRETLDEVTGMSFQNCSVLATEELYVNAGTVKSYLGRPWRAFARTVFLESYVDDFIDPSGWTPWSSNSDEGLDTLYYGEYDNYGPGSGTENRVGWDGFHIMNYSDASNFTASEFITGDAWLESTSFPYDEGI